MQTMPGMPKISATHKFTRLVLVVLVLAAAPWALIYMEIWEFRMFNTHHLDAIYAKLGILDPLAGLYRFFAGEG